MSLKDLFIIFLIGIANIAAEVAIVASVVTGAACGVIKVSTENPAVIESAESAIVVAITTAGVATYALRFAITTAIATAVAVTAAVVGTNTALGTVAYTTTFAPPLWEWFDVCVDIMYYALPVIIAWTATDIYRE
jgi:hypothetical protein